MGAPSLLPKPPDEPVVTDYDRAQATLYLRLLDAETDGATWEEAATLVLGRSATIRAATDVRSIKAPADSATFRAKPSPDAASILLPRDFRAAQKAYAGPEGSSQVFGFSEGSWWRRAGLNCRPQPYQAAEGPFATVSDCRQLPDKLL
jgi:hypothetical protein